MKRTRKMGLMLILAMTLMVSMASAAYAASTNLTGVEDNVIIVQTKQEPDTTYYKMSVNIQDGKVASFSFTRHAGENLITEAFVNFVPDDQKDSLKAMLAEIKYYNDQTIALSDALKVTKYAQAENNDVYSAFQSLWKQAINEAGGKIVESASVSTTQSSNPKTGDNTLTVYVIMALAAIGVIIVINRRKLTT